MALNSELLKQNDRLRQASNGPPSIKPRPAIEDSDAVTRIQKALQQLGLLADLSMNTGIDVPGIFGPATVAAVKLFQRGAFPLDASQWDGLVGKGTITMLDAAIMLKPGPGPAPIPPPGPPPSGDSITQVESSIEPTQQELMSIEPMSVTEWKVGVKGFIRLRPKPIDNPIRKLRFDVRRNGKKYWILVAVPKGVTDVSHVHLFFHPAPGQREGLFDRDYPDFKGLWPDVARYQVIVGNQLAAAGRQEIGIVPLMTSGEFTSLSFLEPDPVSALNPIVAAVHNLINNDGSEAPHIARLNLSSFSVGISALAKTAKKLKDTGFVDEIFDFDGMFSDSPDKFFSGIPGATFKRYTQAEYSSNAPPNTFFAPMWRWQDLPVKYRPETAKKTHGLMPRLLLHALT